MQYTIQHYPTDLIDVVHLSDGTRVVIRPVLPQDAALTQAMVKGLSGTTRHQRFFMPLQELPADCLERFTQLDYRRNMAVIAETVVHGKVAMVAEARYACAEDAQDDDAPELALLVADAWQGRGIGQRLLAALIGHARRWSLPGLMGEALSSNDAMLKVFRRAGFKLQGHPEDRRLVLATLALLPERLDVLVREDRAYAL